MESVWTPKKETEALAEKTLLASLLCSALLYLKECNVTLEDSGKLEGVIGRLKSDGDAAAKLGEMKLLAKANGVKLDLVVSLWYTALFMCGGLGINVNKRSVREDPAHRQVLVQLKMALLEMDAWREGEDEAEIGSLFKAATQESQTLADTLTTATKPLITLQLKMEPEMEDYEDDDEDENDDEEDDDDDDDDDQGE